MYDTKRFLVGLAKLKHLNCLNLEGSKLPLSLAMRLIEDSRFQRLSLNDCLYSFDNPGNGVQLNKKPESSKRFEVVYIGWPLHFQKTSILNTILGSRLRILSFGIGASINNAVLHRIGEACSNL